MSMPSDNSSTWFGRYSDGRTASSVPAEVRLRSNGVEIGFPGAPQALIWPYGALGAGTPVTAKAQDVLLTYSYMPGATLFVADAAFVRLLTKAAPQITARAYGWRSARPWLYVAAAVAALLAGVWIANLSPSQGLARLMPDSVRKTVGEQVVAAMSAGRRTCDAPQGQAALGKLVTRLSQASGSAEGFDVKVVDWGLLNAFAAPGRQIVLTREIIVQARSADEVAGVLAHEMGHGLELHPEAGIIRVIGLTAAVELMMGGSGGALANIGILLTQLGYTRAAEREADQRGLAMLERARISTMGLVEFFKRVETIEKKTGAPEWDILRSHPQSQERARLAAERAGYAATPALEPDDWQALRAICGPAPATPSRSDRAREPGSPKR